MTVHADSHAGVGGLDAGAPSFGTRPGSIALRTALTEAAHAATRTNNTYLAEHHAHLRKRRGLPKAIGATRHNLLIAHRHVVHDQVDYGDLARTGPGVAAPPNTALAARSTNSSGHTVTLEPTG